MTTVLTLDEASTQDRLKNFKLDLPSASGFTFFDTYKHVQYDWHTHPQHQLLYALDGAVRLETRSGVHLITPYCAAWVPARLEHRTAHLRSTATSVFFPAHLVFWSSRRVNILTAPPLLREMIRYAERWACPDSAQDALRDSYFQALAGLCKTWAEPKAPFHLPIPPGGLLARAAEYVLLNLATVSLRDASRHAMMSTRTLRRRFATELGIPWREYVWRARVLRAMELIAYTSLTITEIAHETGFASLSAFTRAFSSLAGEPPAAYRKRVQGRSHLRASDPETPVA